MPAAGGTGVGAVEGHQRRHPAGGEPGVAALAAARVERDPAPQVVERNDRRSTPATRPRPDRGSARSRPLVAEAPEGPLGVLVDRGVRGVQVPGTQRDAVAFLADDAAIVLGHRPPAVGAAEPVDDQGRHRAQSINGRGDQGPPCSNSGRTLLNAHAGEAHGRLTHGQQIRRKRRPRRSGRRRPRTDRAGSAPATCTFGCSAVGTLAPVRRRPEDTVGPHRAEDQFGPILAPEYSRTPEPSVAAEVRGLDDRRARACHASPRAPRRPVHPLAVQRHTGPCRRRRASSPATTAIDFLLRCTCSKRGSPRSSSRWGRPTPPRPVSSARSGGRAFEVVCLVAGPGQHPLPGPGRRHPHGGPALEQRGGGHHQPPRDPVQAALRPLLRQEGAGRRVPARLRFRHVPHRRHPRAGRARLRA